MSGTGRARTTSAVVRAVLSRPWLWPAAWRQARLLVPDRWWRRRPYLPVPDRDWLAFRMTTAYGRSDAPVVVDDFLTWLRWADDLNRQTSRATRRANPSSRRETPSGAASAQG